MSGSFLLKLVAKFVLEEALVQTLQDVHELLCR